MTPKRSALQAIRAFCKECQGGEGREATQAVTACSDTGCFFFPYREGKSLPKGKHRPTAAIKNYCHQNCQGDEGRDEVKHCLGNEACLGPCPVYPFRLGRSPNIREETRAKRKVVGKRRVKEGSSPLLKNTTPCPNNPT